MPREECITCRVVKNLFENRGALRSCLPAPTTLTPTQPVALRVKPASDLEPSPVPAGATYCSRLHNAKTL